MNVKTTTFVIVAGHIVYFVLNRKHALGGRKNLRKKAWPFSAK